MPRRDFTKVPFAATGDVTSIPTAVQPDGSVSMTTGYGFDYQRDNGAGGGTPDPLAKSIPRDATNGILNEITASIGEIQLNGLAIWAASAAPYPIHSMVRHNNTNWRSTVANNSAQPGVAPLANWIDTTAQIAQATESVAGIAKIATSALALAGTDNATIMTPAKTKAVIVQAAPGAATESVAGIVMLSNALNGSDQDKAATENAVGQKLTSSIGLGSTNLNTLSTRSDVGVYFQSLTAGATTALNYPVLMAGTLLVTPSAIAVQQEYTTRSGQKFVRGQDTTTLWGDWRRVDSDKATESFAGVMEIATQALTNAGTNDYTAITPKKLLAWFVGMQNTAGAWASTTVRGFISLATDTLISQGTDDTTAVTPVKMVRGLQMSIGATGYLVLPWWLGSVKFVWGSATANSDVIAGVAVTFPLGFSATPWAITTGVATSSGDVRIFSANAVNRSASGFSMQTRTSNTGTTSAVTASYLAIGI